MGDDVSKEVKQATYNSRNTACKYKINYLCVNEKNMHACLTHAICCCMWIK